MQSNGSSAPVLILLAPQFDEQFVIDCVCQMREKGVEVALIGQKIGSLPGLHGVSLQLDQPMADLEQRNGRHPVQMVILPGPYECTLQLLLDPRVHRLVEKAFDSDGYVATAVDKTKELLLRSGLDTPVAKQRFLFQGVQSTGSFTNRLIEAVTGPSC